MATAPSLRHTQEQAIRERTPITWELNQIAQVISNLHGAIVRLQK